MRVAALYDIHGNLPALEAVLDEVDRLGVDRIVVGGDVLPGPMPREALERLLTLAVPVQFLRGNGDREVLSLLDGGDPASIPAAYRDVLVWTAAQLGPAHRAAIASWPTTVRLAVEGVGGVLCCHATPASDTPIFTRLTPDEQLAPVFAGVEASVVVCGHTHMPFDRTVARTRIVNAGSVGMPFGATGAWWLRLGPGVEERHTAYDLARAADRVRRTAYPRADEFAERAILRPPSEAEMLAAYGKAELRGL